jgi:hypothetical protein
MDSLLFTSTEVLDSQVPMLVDNLRGLGPKVGD